MKSGPTRDLNTRRWILRRGLAVSALGALGLRCAVADAAGAAKDVAAAADVPGVPSLDPTLAGLTVLVQTLYPHPALPASIYQDVARALTAQASADPASKAVLEKGLEELESAAPGGWLARTASQRVAMLEQRQATPFFQFVRGSAAFLLYTRPDVWKAMGYGGDAWSFGGYGPKELNAIDWLPDPAPLS
jgi:hypothetical protein